MTTSSKKFCMLLEITEGISTPLPFNADSLREDNIVAILDEVHEKLWVWLGTNTGLIKRRGGMRVARSVKRYGKDFGNHNVGKFLDVIETIDGKKINDEDKDKFQTILELFSIKHDMDPTGKLATYIISGDLGKRTYYGLTAKQRDKLVQEAISASSAGDDDRRIEQIVGQYRP